MVSMPDIQGGGQKPSGGLQLKISRPASKCRPHAQRVGARALLPGDIILSVLDGTSPARGFSAQQPDVFISHSSVQKEWVETLADNLQRAGKTVFLDLWRLVPGKDWVDGLREGLASCRSAVLVVSPEALQSGWVREEYEVLKRRQARDPAFAIVPIVHSDVDGEPFYGSIQWVDFRDPAKHLQAFARLLAGLEGRPPGPNPSYDARLWTPLPEPGQRPVAAAERHVIKHAFSQLLSEQAVVILAQEGLGSPALAAEIRKHAVERFGDNAVHQLSPSYVTAEDGLAPYFESLLSQLNLPTRDASPLNFDRRLARRLESGEPMCLLFTGIEHSPPLALKSLCGVLRSLNDRYGQPRILMCGGERLCEMRYANGIHSFLSHAQEELWPDPGVPEIQAEASAQDCGSLAPGLIALLQELTGGHFGLLRELLRHVKVGERSRDALTRVVLDSPTIWAAVVPLHASEEARRFLRSIIDREELGEAPRYIFNPTLRRIYWLNLVQRQQSGDRLRLVWRSRAINEAVRRIIRSSDGHDRP